MTALSNRRAAVEQPEDSACPNCGGHGLARALSIKEYQQTISYECERCHHTWSTGTTAEEKLSYPRMM